MTVLVTGAGGFVGGHLCAALAKSGTDVVAIGRHGGKVAGRVRHFVGTDTTPDATLLADVMSRFQPEVVFHLAGTASAPSVAELYAVNTLYAVELLEAAGRMKRPPRVVMLGSAAEYGEPLKPGRLMSEADPERPISNYGIAKLAQTHHALAAAKLTVVVARLFNPIGAGMPEGTAAGRFVRQIADLHGGDGVIHTAGSLDAVRDFVDVADAVDALIRLGSDSIPAGRVYNLCTGHGTTMTELTTTLARLAPGSVEFRAGEGSAGIAWAVGNPSRLAQHGVTLRLHDLEGILSRMLAAAGASAVQELQ
jgi:GDP-4-dehydro-6-deoxy-D-mannose reductase